MLRVQLQPAYVLHARGYRESSQLLEVFSRDFGRLGVVARGARGPRSRWKNILQPFRPLLISWSQRGDLGTLSSADQVAAPPALAGDALYCGFYINELMIRLLHRGDPHPELFERYRDTLAELASGQSPQPGLRIFEKHLLEATGYGLLLEHEYGSEQPLDAAGWYDYRPEQGAVRVSDQAHGRPAVISGAALQALRCENLQAGDLPPLRDLMRRVLRHHLGDKPLASEALYRPNRRRPQSDTTGKQNDE